MSISIYIDTDSELRAVERTLQEFSQKAPTVLTKALNSTAREVRKQLSKDMKHRYNLTKDKGRLNATKAAKIKNATQGNMAAQIKSVGQKLDLMDLYVNPRSINNGNVDVFYHAGVLKKNRKPLGAYHGFIYSTSKPFVVQFKSKHIAIVERVIGRPMDSNPKKEFLQKLLSPAVPHMMFREEERDIAAKIVTDRLQREIDKFAQKTLDKMRK